MQLKVDSLLERLISFKLSQKKMCSELGFDSSRETYLKSDNSIAIIIEISKAY